MLADDALLALNPWWRSEGWEAGDAHLRRLREHPVRLPSPVVDAVDLETPAVHVVRGPRQVGKSTALKLLVRRALAAGRGRNNILYLALDLLEDRPATAVVDSVTRALELSGRRDEHPTLLLLDEVTATRSWQTAVKVLWDRGTIDRDVVICTGSSAVDLERAPDRLPGRRGAGRDLLVLPQGFAAFARAVDRDIPPSPGLTVSEILTAEGRRTVEEARVHVAALRRALERYLVFGGLPAAVAEAVSGLPEPSEKTVRVLWDSLVREIQRRGANLPAAHALLERLFRSLGSKTSWRRLGREMDIPLGRRGPASHASASDPRTVRQYVELLCAGYFVLVVYFWRRDSGGADLSRDKKLYFGDPLLHTIVARRLPGLRADRHAQVENALALALLRRYEPAERIAETFSAPERLHVWSTSKGGEIDFVCGPHDRIEAVEVADWARLDRRKATSPMRSLPGRPSLVATRTEFEFGPTANLIPASILLWALGDAI